MPIHQDDGKNGPRLNGEVKHLGALIVKAQQGARQNEVSGGGNRQKFSQTFHHAHDGGFDQQCNVHAGILVKKSIIGEPSGLNLTPLEHSRQATGDAD